LPPEGGIKFLPAPEVLAAAIFPSRGAAFGLGEGRPPAPVRGARTSGSAECRYQNQNEEKAKHVI